MSELRAPYDGERDDPSARLARREQATRLLGEVEQDLRRIGVRELCPIWVKVGDAIRLLKQL